MWPDRVSNPGPLTYESGVLPTALRGPAYCTLQPVLSKHLRDSQNVLAYHRYECTS